jgi:hypothetical protein
MYGRPRRSPQARQHTVLLYIPIPQYLTCILDVFISSFHCDLYKYNRVLTTSLARLLQARFALALFGARVSVSPALESDLEPLHSLQKIQLHPVVFDTLTLPATFNSHLPRQVSQQCR